MDNSARLPFRRGHTAAGSPGSTTTIGSSIKIASPVGATQISMLPASLGLVGQANEFRPDLATIDPRFNSVDSASNYPGLVAATLALLGSDRRQVLRAVQATSAFQIGGAATLAAPVYLARGMVNDYTNTTIGQFGFVDSGAVTGAGAIGKPIDPAYTPGTWISAYDWYYVVDEGPALVTLGASVTVGVAVMWDAAGKAITYVAAATNANIGTLIAVSGNGSSASSGVGLVWVNPGLRMG